ncbi:MAG: hypothetical protein LAO20_21345 [Acidobacteriia bacterium]|nr:hypothetical protein [Terriglobia bacterium]
MGVRASQAGVTLQFLKADGTPDTSKPRVTGEFAYFFSLPRPEAPNDTDPIHGSPDWLTDIIVVDNPAKLAQMPLTQTGILLTSAASKMVTVRWDANGRSGSVSYCLTLCEGIDGQYQGEERYYAYAVKILPYGTDIRNLPGLWPDWVAATRKFVTQSARLAPDSTKR